MKRILFLILFLSSLARAAETGYGQLSLSCSAVTVTGACTTFNVHPPDFIHIPQANSYTWQTIFTGGTPTSVTILLQGSIDATTWSTIDTSTSTAGETRNKTGTAYSYFRCNVTAYNRNGTSASCQITANFQSGTGGGAIDTVNGQTGTVVLGAADVSALANSAGAVGNSNLAAGAVTDDKASLAVKPAVTVVATANTALSGLLTIDGVTTVDGSIVLATAQSTGSQNGPWVTHSGAWTRPTWYAAANVTQAFQFITAFVRLGTVNGGSTWRITSPSGTITIDTTSTTWARTPYGTWLPASAPGGSNTQVEYNASGAHGGDSTFTFNGSTKVVRSSYSATATGPAIDPVAYGAVRDGSTDDTAAVQAAVDYSVAHGGYVVIMGNYSVNRVSLPSYANIWCQGGNFIPRVDAAFVTAGPTGFVAGVTIRNCSFTGGSNVIDMASMNQGHFENLSFQNSTGCGLTIVQGEQFVIKDIVSSHNGANGFSGLCTGDASKSLFSGSIPNIGTPGLARAEISNIREQGSLNAGPGSQFYGQWLWWAGGNGIAESHADGFTCFFSCSTGYIQMGSTGNKSLTTSRLCVMDADDVAASLTAEAIGLNIAGSVSASEICAYNPGENYNNMTVQMYFGGQVNASTIHDMNFITGVDNVTTFGLKVGTVFQSTLSGIQGACWFAVPNGQNLIGSGCWPTNLPATGSSGNGVMVELSDTGNHDIYMALCGRYDCGLAATSQFHFQRNTGAGTFEDLLLLNSTQAGFVHPLSQTETTAPTGASAIDWLWADSTAHRLKMNNNNGGAVQVVGSGADINTSDQVTVTHLASALPAAQGGTANAFFTVAGPASSAKTYTFPNASSTMAITVASGTKALATSAIGSAACSSAQTATATGTATTDVVTASFNGDPTAVTGYVPLTAGMLTIIVYPTADTFNAKVCNNTSSSITPGAITLNWRVTR